MNSSQSAIIRGVSIALFSGNQVALIRRGKAPFKGCWSFPGGHIEPGAFPEYAARRELREETGIDLSQMTYFRDYHPVPRQEMQNQRYVLSIFTAFTAELMQLDPRDDALDAKWFNVDAVGRLDSTTDLIELVAEICAFHRKIDKTD